MKTLLHLSLLGLALNCWSQTGNSLELSEKLAARYPLEAGIITYVIQDGATGEASLSFDRNGWRSIEKKSVTIQRYGVTSTTSKAVITDGNMVYSINGNERTGEQTVDYQWSQLLGYKDLDQAKMAIYQQRGGKLVGLDTLLGKPCNIWQFESGAITEIWEWNALPLAITRKVPGVSYRMVASAIKPMEAIDETVFALPDSISWQD